MQKRHPDHPLPPSSRCLSALVVLLLLILTYILPPVADAAELRISGYIKNFNIALDMPPVEGMEDQAASGVFSNRFRTRIFWQPLGNMSLDVAYELMPRVMGEDATSAMVILKPMTQGGYRIYDLEPNLYPSTGEAKGSFSLVQNLDRLKVTLCFGFGDIYLGRQPIAFGSARAVNPTDVLAPFAYQELDKEERYGVDGLRLRVPLGMMSELDVGAVFGDEFHIKRSAGFVRLKGYAWQTDLCLIATAFKENLLLGLDVARAIGGAGTWIEAAYTMPNALKNDNTDNQSEEYWRASTGVDYNLADGLYGFLEYHYSGAGSEQPADYLNNAETVAHSEGGVYLLGRHYLVPGLMYQVTSLLILLPQVLFNIEDGSCLASARLEYNIKSDVYLEAGAFVGLGKDARLAGNDGSTITIVPGSEFGLYPSFYFTSIRVYF